VEVEVVVEVVVDVEEEEEEEEEATSPADAPDTIVKGGEADCKSKCKRVAFTLQLLEEEVDATVPDCSTEEKGDEACAMGKISSAAIIGFNATGAIGKVGEDVEVDPSDDAGAFSLATAFAGVAGVAADLLFPSLPSALLLALLISRIHFHLFRNASGDSGDCELVLGMTFHWPLNAQPTGGLINEGCVALFPSESCHE